MPPPAVLNPWVGAVAVLAVGVFFWATAEAPSPILRAVQAGLILGEAVVVLALSRYRYVMFGAVMATTLAGWGMNVTQEPFIIASWALYRAVLLGGRRRFVLVSLGGVSVLLFVVMMFAGADVDETFLLRSLTSITLLTGGWALGAQGRSEAEQLKRLQRARERNQLLEERARVARDLHDVLSHTLSRIGLQATVAAEVGERMPLETLETLRVIEKSSRDALDQVRDVIADIRGEARRWEPTLAVVESLLEDSRRAGLRIAVHIDAPGGRSLRVGQQTVHIIQEIITNIGKHSSEGRGEVWIDAVGSDLRIRSANPYDDSRRAATPGLGIRGVRERAEARGGTVEVEDGGGVFRIDIRLPGAASSGEAMDDPGCS